MELKNHFEILYNDSPNPCSLTDMETHEVVFMNYAMQKMLKDSNGFTKEDEKSLKCYERMYGVSSPCSFCLNEQLKDDEFIESHIHNTALKKHFRVNNAKVQYKGRSYNLCKYFVTSSYINQLITLEEAMTRSVEIFGSQKDIDQMTNSFLELVGEFYEADHAYCVYFNADRTKISDQYLWSKDKNDRPVDSFTAKLPLEKLITWMEQNSERGIIEAKSDNSVLDEKHAKKKLLRMFRVENFTLCIIENEKKECIGGVGFSNRAEKAFDRRLLKAVTRFIQDGFSKTGMQEELKSISETDFLTGFYSRPRYAKELERYAMFPPGQLGVVFINLNGLRKTNEYMGFAKGDEQIAKSAEMLKMFFQESFFRISGDEFVCFCEDTTEKLFMKKVNRLRNELKRTGDFPFAIGHAWKQGKVETERLIAEADTVMYINKQEYYHTTHRASAEDSDSILSDLLSCISNEEFLVYLQPQVDLKDDKLIGAEALVRRYDKGTKKMIFPDQFIPLYEQKSIIRHVDIFVLNKVCQMLSQWGKTGKQVPISVNLSRVTLIEFDIVNTISKICDNHGIDHGLVIIEVTERIGLIENEVATSLIDDFQSKGFKVSLDDFGCAYSNIVTLANISVDEVKIDKSLVDNLIDNEKNRIIVDSMVTMCNKFANTHTLAEGIETAEQAKILRDFGCTFGQGYLYSRPIPNEEFFQKYIKP